LVEALGETMTKSSVLVLGGTGNLGESVRRLSTLFTEFSFFFPSREEFPLGDRARICDRLDEIKPDTIINGIAWTNVDEAEKNHPEARYLNAVLPGVIASWCSDRGARFIHYSTNYVFNGSHPSPYLETDPKSPLSFYGISKSDGEDAVLGIAAPSSVIVRTSGLYGFTPNNFVMKILNRAKRGDELRVVVDQEMTPTNADDLARFSLAILKREQLPKVIHFANNGSTNWNEVARAIYLFLGQDPEKVKKVQSSEYPSTAKRPHQGRLGTLYPDLVAESNRDWNKSLDRFLREVVDD
jgi:dTDP-4-dehydrorhamnose reductase